MKTYSKYSQYVPNQFPSVYREDGPEFVSFVREFYRWMETEGPDEVARRLLSLRDVDDTDSDKLKHFVFKYMNGVSSERMGDVRFLQKHILDLYRSKGSVEGLKVLFRLIYGEEIDYYSPSRDMLLASGGTWVEPRYIEVSYSAYNASYLGRTIRGLSSDSTAIVEDYVEMNKRGRRVRAMFLSNVDGPFEIGEGVVYTGSPIIGCPIILGSVGSIELSTTVESSTVADRYSDATGGGLFRVSRLEDYQEGQIEFTLKSSGSGYTLSATIDVVAGELLTEDGDDVVTEESAYIDVLPGTGASFRISSLTDVETLTVDTTTLAAYDGDAFTDATFLYELPILTENGFTLTDESTTPLLTSTTGATINDDVVISDWENGLVFEAGSIEFIRQTGQGVDYVTNPTVFVYDELIYSTPTSNGNGGVMGFDASVTAKLSLGEDVTAAASVIDSGFGYLEGDVVTLGWAGNEFIVLEDGSSLTTEAGDVIYYGSLPTDKTLTGVVSLTPIGRASGYWIDEGGMLNSNKRIQDSFYYQEYSYDVLTGLPISVYRDSLMKMYHPAGSELFGTTVLKQTETDVVAVDAEVTQE